jgi:cytochrome c oxidase cbb3-type subunit I
MNLEFTKKPNGAALAYMVAGAIWFLIGTLYGMAGAIHLVAPEFFNNISWLVFGRVRPSHVNTVIFGFTVTMLTGCGLYFVPALLKTRLWSERLAWVSFVLWNLAVVSGPVSFSLGYSQGREYAEYIWSADVAVMASMVLILFNLIMTIANRREPILYVSVWYFTATFLWTAGVYPIGNVMWHPGTGAVSGILDSLYLWFYGHNLPGVLLTPLAVGAAFYVIPRVTRTPLYSHAMSLIGFWTLVALYTHIGGHHLLQAPVPTWLKTMSIVDSMAMAVPVFTVLVNLWMTARGRGGRLFADPAGRFVLGGTIWYLLTCIQGPLQSLPYLQQVTHFTNWTVGHAHIAILGFVAYIALGAMWHILPQVTGRRIYSQHLVNAQFWLVTLGLTGFFIVLTIAGLIQGHAWHNGEMVYRVLPEISVYMALRAAFGISVISAAVVGLYNMVMTIRHGEHFDPALEEEPA